MKLDLCYPPGIGAGQHLGGAAREPSLDKRVRPADHQPAIFFRQHYRRRDAECRIVEIDAAAPITNYGIAAILKDAALRLVQDVRQSTQFGCEC